MTEKWCRCKYRKQKNCNYEGIIFVEGNYGYCERCEKHIYPQTIKRLFGSSLTMGMSKKRLWKEDD